MTKLNKRHDYLWSLASDILPGEVATHYDTRTRKASLEVDGVWIFKDLHIDNAIVTLKAIREALKVTANRGLTND